MGKTNMHELAFGISGYNPAFNTGPYVGVRNAYNITRMPGGREFVRARFVRGLRENTGHREWLDAATERAYTGRGALSPRGGA